MIGWCGARIEPSSAACIAESHSQSLRGVRVWTAGARPALCCFNWFVSLVGLRLEIGMSETNEPIRGRAGPVIPVNGLGKGQVKVEWNQLADVEN